MSLCICILQPNNIKNVLNKYVPNLYMEIKLYQCYTKGLEYNSKYILTILYMYLYNTNSGNKWANKSQNTFKSNFSVYYV